MATEAYWYEEETPRSLYDEARREVAIVVPFRTANFHQSPLDDCPDPCDPVTAYVWYRFADDRRPAPSTLYRAFSELLNTKGGCGHDYDCCGCRSFRVDEVLHEDHGNVIVRVGSWRNY